MVIPIERDREINPFKNVIEAGKDNKKYNRAEKEVRICEIAKRVVNDIAGLCKYIPTIEAVHSSPIHTDRTDKIEADFHQRRMFDQLDPT
jgi:hypothetical protein